MEIELRAQHTENLFTLLHMAERIDLQRGYGIIEARYSDDQPRDDHGRWTSEGGSSGENSGGENSVVAEESETASNAHPRNEELEKQIKKCIDAPDPVFADDLEKKFQKDNKGKWKIYYSDAWNG